MGNCSDHDGVLRLLRNGRIKRLNETREGVKSLGKAGVENSTDLETEDSFRAPGHKKKGEKGFWKKIFYVSNVVNLTTRREGKTRPGRRGVHPVT